MIPIGTQNRSYVKNPSQQDIQKNVWRLQLFREIIGACNRNLITNRGHNVTKIWKDILYPTL